jgi:hypothetical protein
MRSNGRIPVGLPCLAEPFAQRQIPSDETVGQQVKASFLASDRTYGARRVWETFWQTASNAACTRSSG